MILGNSSKYSNRSPPPAEIEDASDSLYSAIKTVRGVNQARLIEILGRKNNYERTFILQKYREKYSRSLSEDLREEVQGDFGELLSLLGTPLAEVEAKLLHGALGTGEKEGNINPKHLIRVVVRRANVEVEAIRSSYAVLYGTDLVQDVKEKLEAGEFRDFIVTSLEAVQEDPSSPSILSLSLEDEVKRLYKAGQGRRSAPVEEEFISLLSTRPTNHLRNVLEAYKERNKKTLREVIEEEFEGNMRDALVFAIRCVEEPLELVSEIYDEAFQMLYEQDKKPLNICLVQYQTVAGDVKETFKKRFGKGLAERLRELLPAGDYLDLALALINEAQ